MKRHDNRRGSKAAAEVAAELRGGPGASSPDVADRRGLNSYARSAADLLGELAGAGFVVGSIRDLLAQGEAIRKAVPILVRWLPLVSDSALKEDIVRTLSVPWAHSAAPALVAEYERVDDLTGTGLRWAIGNALEVLANDEIADDLIRLAKDRRFGRAREMVVLGLAKLSSPDVPGVLSGLLTDDDVVGHAVMALGRLEAQQARQLIVPLLKHSKRWIRKEAGKAIDRIDKRQKMSGAPRM